MKSVSLFGQNIGLVVVELTVNQQLTNSYPDGLELDPGPSPCLGGRRSVAPQVKCFVRGQGLRSQRERTMTTIVQ
eukprot:scaffold633_cov288-Ochromonas_danica.AAC.34